MYSVGEDEGGMVWENGTETCILSYVKQTASPDSNHETECLGLVHWMTRRDGMGREVGGGFRMGNTYTHTHIYICGGFMSMYGKTTKIL